MSIRIDPNLCIGCGRCTEICPGSLINISEDGKAQITWPRDCWGCASCLKECPISAISLHLGADMGGMGSEMTAKRQKQFLTWTITRPNGEAVEIVIDTTQSNKY